MGLRYFDHFLKDMFEEMDEEGVSTLIVDLRGNGGGNSVFGDMLLYHLNVPTGIRDFSMAIKFSRLYKQFFPENYEIYAAGYTEKFNGRQLPDSLIVTTDIIQEDTMHRGYFRNLTDKTSDYYTESPRNIFKGKTYFLVGDGTYSSAIILSTLVKDNKLFTVAGQPARGRPSHYGETLFLKLPNTGILCHISCKKFFRPNIEKDAEDSLYPDVEIWPTFNDIKFGRDPVFDWVLEDAKTNPAPMK
jgi:C-terminal processing protease CtpA/Prc